jgi:hypothetical protein
VLNNGRAVRNQALETADPVNFLIHDCIVSSDLAGFGIRRAGGRDLMAEDSQIRKEITRDLLDQLISPIWQVRENAVEALAVSTRDEDWRPNELIRQGGIEIITGLFDEENTHIVLSALDIIIAIAATGEEEALITGGVIDALDKMQDHRDPLIQKKVQEALWLLMPKVEDVVTSKPQDEY